MKDLDFFDCNTWLGRPMNLPAGFHGPADFSAAALLAAMDRAGIGRALVWHAAQRDADPVTGNQLLRQAVAAHANRLVPCWAILPPDTGELGDLDAFFDSAKEAGVRAFRAFPDINRYLLRYETMGEILDRMVEARLPLMLTVPGPVSWEGVYQLMSDAPELILILTNMGVWGSDRYFRPLLRVYPDVYVETNGHIVDGGIESLVETSGAGRLLFGSGYPEQYHGAMMLALAHAKIAQEDKRAIASGNLARLLGEAER
jgi:predicted TIM-barrel fold metal-dependent hydrolase